MKAHNRGPYPVTLSFSGRVYPPASNVPCSNAIRLNGRGILVTQLPTSSIRTREHRYPSILAVSFFRTLQLRNTSFGNFTGKKLQSS